MVKNQRKGFTLIELLVVIAIIGLLASVVMVSLDSARGKGRDARRISDLRQMQIAVEMHYNNYGEYPGVDDVYYTNSGGATWYIRNPSATSDQSDSRLIKFYDDFRPFIPNLPQALSQSKAVFIHTDGSCQTANSVPFMQYIRLSGGQKYKISVRMETDCQKVLSDGGTNTCCSVFSSSRGRSYEVYELFDSSSAAVMPTW